VIVFSVLTVTAGAGAGDDGAAGADVVLAQPAVTTTAPVSASASRSLGTAAWPFDAEEPESCASGEHTGITSVCGVPSEESSQ
jgi:hypothetical protein